jgi:hypothetical protein
MVDSRERLLNHNLLLARVDHEGVLVYAALLPVESDGSVLLVGTEQRVLHTALELKVLSV